MEKFAVVVVGLGYVGLPLAVEFGKKFETIGYDLSETKIAHYRNFFDPNGEVSTEDLKAASGLIYSKPVYRDFRSGDVRHSLADIGKARALLAYEPSYRIREGLVEAKEWYVNSIAG